MEVTSPATPASLPRNERATAPGEPAPVHMLHEALDRLLRYWETNQDPEAPLHLKPSPEALEPLFGVEPEGRSPAELLQDVDRYLKHAVPTMHPLFCDKLFSPPQPEGLIGGLVELVTNTTMATFAASPAGTTIENNLIRKLSGIVGYAPEEGDGIFTPGGTFSNWLALLCARYRHDPRVKKRGLAGQPPQALFVSDQAHYSLDVAANLLGVGTDHSFRVESDAAGRMIPDALEATMTRAEAEGFVPLLVVATSGTTVTGSFDPIVPIQRIAAAHGAWLHVDGSFGGCALLSPKRAPLLEGVHLADSMTWDFHKILGAPVPCSVFLTRHGDILERASAATDVDDLHASYLFKTEASLDLGRKCLQCVRPTDAVKLWFIWRHHGTQGLAARVERLFSLRDQTVERLEALPNVELALRPEYLNICFRMTPPSPDRDGDRFNQDLARHLADEGRVAVSDAPFKGRTVVRPAVVSPAFDPEGFVHHVADVAARI